MVDRQYLTGKAAPAGLAKLLLDQQLIPAAIDIAGTIEAGIERVAVQVRRAPAVAIGMAVMMGIALSIRRSRERSRGGGLR